MIAGDYAISDWAQAGMGGRALLRKTDKGWGIHLCAGAGLRDAAELEKIGVPADIADDLAAQLAHAEAMLPAAQVSLYDSFDGMMVVDDSLI
ncbi:copper uptake system-associated protein [Devosia riboflavina]|uniref:copper uptake system-associated protein n=1 Tax=Devosia riboflavina TaxID=46914 RepID=UPI00068969C2|nr:copper uptake system-associated protein [Devosia riboflavina]